MADIRIDPPGKDSPGYLRRARRALGFQDAISEGDITVQILDNLIEFILDYVVEPTDRDEARELLLDASENDYNTILAGITAGKADPTSADSEALSESGSGE